MSPSMIDRLINADPSGRAALMEDVYKRNMDFFKRKHPALLSVINQVKCPYSFEMTERFLDIIDGRTGQPAHPPDNLDGFSVMLGDWVHSAWVDLFNFRVVSPEKYPIHNQPVQQLHRQLMCSFPEYLIRFAQRKINLKKLGEDKRFSPPTIFLGIFHGLHIDYYLSRTDLAYLLFVEPDLERFEVSCYFLDYEQIRERFGTFLMSVGPDLNSMPIRSFFSNYHVSRQMWTRILPAYEHERNAHFVQTFTMHQTSLASVIFPIDNEILGLQQAVDNLKNCSKIFTSSPKLSKKSRIAIVATGPSLDSDLDWLKDNRDKLIIFSVASAVKALRRHNIRPDFQFSLETVMPIEGLQLLEMFTDVPTILYFKAPPSFGNYMDEILLCGTEDKASPVSFRKTLSYIAPSTTNFAITFALSCRPRELYFVGCDFGYISLQQSHASGTIYNADPNDADKNVRTQLHDQSQIICEANFQDTKEMVTTPFLSQTRITAEEAILANGSGIKVFNLSNGAKIKGTIPKRSGVLQLKDYRDRSSDINSIKNAFRAAQKGVNWDDYPLTGKALVERFKQGLLERIQMEEFSWQEFNKIIDYALQDTVETCKYGEKDRRLDIYVRFFVDIFSTWYSTVVFFDDQLAAEKVYRFGLAKITEIINAIEWPIEELA